MIELDPDDLRLISATLEQYLDYLRQMKGTSLTEEVAIRFDRDQAHKALDLVTQALLKE